MNASARKLLRNLWRALRTLSGDDAYERYVEHLRCTQPGHEPLDRCRFYVLEQQRRFSGGPTRCC